MRNFFVSHKNPVSLILAVIIGCGIFAYARMQSSLFPEVTFPKVKVIAENGLQPVSKMMITVTRPLENAIKRVPGLKTVRSTTSRGSCEISAFMDWNSDIDLSRQQIESSINEIKDELPPETGISIEKMNPSILPVIGYILEGKGYSNIELNQIANYTIRPFLSQAEGTSEIRVIGGKTKEYRVELRPGKMASLHITPAMVSNAINESNFLKSNGYLTDYNRLYLSITDAMVSNIDELNNLVISNDGKRVVCLSDIARVKIAEQVEYTRVNADGKSAVLIAVVKQPDFNLIELTDNIRGKINELNKTILPKGISLKPYYVQADFVNDSIKSVRDSLWIGLLLAIMVVILFLRSYKSSTVVLITIPITLAMTLTVLYCIGYNFNIMTLGAIAASIGLIIDDAIVVTEHIHRAHENHPGKHARELLAGSVRFLLPAMIGSSLSTIVIFFPFILLSGVAGAYFRILTNTMIITLVCSFIVTWIGLPVVYLFLSGKKPGKELIHPRHHHSNIKWISWTIRHPAAGLLFVLILVSSAVFVYHKLETGFLPEMDEGSIVLDYKSPPGTSLQETDRMLQEVEKMFPSVPEIESYSRRTGTQMGFFITEPNTGDYLIHLKKERKRTTEEVIDDIRKRIESTQPALVVDFGQVIGDMLGDLMSSTQPIEIKIFGNDHATLQKIAEDVSGKVGKIRGTADVFNGITIAGPSVNIEPDYRRLAQFGITPADFQVQLQTQLEGVEVGSIYEKEQATTIRMVYPDAVNTGFNRFNNSSVFLPDGRQKLISQLAKVNIDPGSAEIDRENLQSVVIVTARLNNRDLGSVMTEIKQKISSSVKLPQGYHIDYGGLYHEQQQSFGELTLILFLAALLVFTVMMFLFKDIRISALIILISLIGVAGCIVAIYLTGTALNVGSYTGIIMIIGIICENAVFTFLQLNYSLKIYPVDEAIINAVSVRLRPNLMTAFGAIVALLPIALSLGTGTQMHQPLAIAVIGGFVVAVPLLLFVYPAILRLMLRNYKPEQEPEETLAVHAG